MNIESSLQFKTDRQRLEFAQADPRIQALLFLSAFHMKSLWNYDAVVTSILRTKAEQQQLMKAGNTNIAVSPHMFGRAADIRLKDLDGAANKILVLTKIINTTFKRSDKFNTALAHGEGDGFHLHLQVPILA